MRAEQGMGRRSVDREVDAKDKRFSRYKGAARARRFGDDTALRVRPRAAWPLADLSVDFVGDDSDLGIVRTSGAANDALTTRDSLCWRHTRSPRVRSS